EGEGVAGIGRAIEPESRDLVTRGTVPRGRIRQDALHARSTRTRADQPSQHRAYLQPGLAGRTSSFRDGIRRRSIARGSRASANAEAKSGPDAQGGAGGGFSSRAPDRTSRSEADEHTGERGPATKDLGLRVGAASGERHQTGDAVRRDHGHAGLFFTGTHRTGIAIRSAKRCFFAGHDSVRAADWKPAVSRGNVRRADAADP